MPTTAGITLQILLVRTSSKLLVKALNLNLTYISNSPLTLISILITRVPITLNI